LSPLSTPRHGSCRIAQDLWFQSSPVTKTGDIPPCDMSLLRRLVFSFSTCFESFIFAPLVSPDCRLFAEWLWHGHRFGHLQRSNISRRQTSHRREIAPAKGISPARWRRSRRGSHFDWPGGLRHAHGSIQCHSQRSRSPLQPLRRLRRFRREYGESERGCAEITQTARSTFPRRTHAILCGVQAGLWFACRSPPRISGFPWLCSTIVLESQAVLPRRSNWNAGPRHAITSARSTH